MTFSLSGADYWFYTIGVNVIPADSLNKTPKVKWTEWQDKPIPEEVYEDWKNTGAFRDGCAIVVGRIWRGDYTGKYLVCIDIDNEKGIKEVLFKFGKADTIEKLSTMTIVEQRLDSKDKAHIYFIVEKPLSKKSGIGGPNVKNTEIPAIEVKSEGKHGIMCCTPSLHANGHPYQILGTQVPFILDEAQSKALDDKIDQMYKAHNHGSTCSNSTLSAELRLIANTRRIGKNTPKISDGSRSNTLISLVRVILNQHHQSVDTEDFRSFIGEVNQKLCDPPLSEDELNSIWKNDSEYLLKDLESGKIRPKKYHENENIKSSSKIKSKADFLTYKYTLKGQIYEAALICGKPFFLTVKDGEIILESFLEEETRILRPPAPEESPSYIPYTFKNTEEIKKYVDLISSQDFSLDRIAEKIREQISKYIVHHDYILDYITALILFSYFQDKFPTVPYSMFVSDNGSGKSTIGNVFECFGYRCINMTDPTTANIFRIFGTVEQGQCTLVLDEAEKIDQEKEMMSILKTGYENGKKVQRINPFGKQEHFHTFGLKTMLAERTPNPFHAKGVLDRTFIISNYKGRPRLDIKETKISKKGKTEFSFYKNLLLIYRLLRFDERIPDITTGLEGRDKELCKPLLQLFFNTKFQPKIEKALEIMLDEKNTRKANSLEREVLEVIMDLIRSDYKDGIIPIPKLWEQIINKTNATKNQFDELTVISESHGTISKNTILKMIRDRFGAKQKRYSEVRCLCFDIDKILRNYEEYVKEEKPTKIICKLIDLNDANDANDANIESLFNSFTLEAPSFSDINQMHSGEEYSKASHGKWLVKKTKGIFVSDRTLGFGNSVIPVNPVTNAQSRNIPIGDNLIEIQKPIDQTSNLYKIWENGDIRGCKNCNDRGDIHYMKIHPCKNNKKK